LASERLPEHEDRRDQVPVCNYLEEGAEEGRRRGDSDAVESIHVRPFENIRFENVHKVDHYESCFVYLLLAVQFFMDRNLKHFSKNYKLHVR
jgi:hypothetical protein